MLRAGRWITTLTIGWALACAASLQAQGLPKQKTSEPVDYVVEIPPEEESTDDYYEQDVPGRYAAEDDQAQPLDEAPDKTGVEEPELIKERFPSGAIHIERQVTQDARGNYLNHGTWKMWDERGNLVAQGQYEYGNRTGTWIRWYRNVAEATILSKLPYSQFAGPYISQATFTNDQLDGVWTIYDGKTRKISEWHFEQGHRHGPSTWWFGNGKKMREAQFTNGDMNGQYYEWAPDGSLRVKETYEEGRKLAVKTSHHKGGAKKSEGTYLFAKDIEHSPDDWWSCKLVTTVKTGKDEKHGPWVSWFASGQKQLEGNYEHDLQVGKFSWWHANGQRALEGTFDRGKQDGTWTWWHPNGQKSIQGEYVKGNPSGRWTWWKDDGQVVQSADLSHSEGIVIESPRELEVPNAPQMSSPIRRVPTKR